LDNSGTTNSIINNPNNKNIDEDILNYITTPNPTSFDEVHNLPQINGVPLQHPSITSLGFVEASNNIIINMLDKVWKNEIINDSNFWITHRDGVIKINPSPLVLHIKHNLDSTCDADYYVGYVTGLSDEYFTMYVSNKSTDKIYDTANVLKIIGFIRSGVEVFIDKSLHHKWLHTTSSNTEAIIIE